jgi:hypothetical protein
MSQYTELDKRILSGIAEHGTPWFNRSINEEVARIAKLSGREKYRIIDARLQALRRQGLIRHFTKAETGGDGGWRLMTGNDAAHLEPATSPQQIAAASRM